MGLENKFNKLLEQWHEHVDKIKYCADGASKIRACESYKQLVEMGTQILPLIRDKCANKKAGDMFYIHKPGRYFKLGQVGFWEVLVGDLVGNDFQIPKGKKVYQGKSLVGIDSEDPTFETLKWLELNMDKYLPKSE